MIEKRIFSMMKRYEACFLGLTICLLHPAARADLVLVRGGQAQAVIVTASDASDKTREAADDFRQVLAQMTGATLPLRTEDQFSGSDPAILIGPSAWARQKSIMVKQDEKDHDHYIIRTGANYVALIGNDSGQLTGTAYAVYDLLQRLGCGWFGVDPKWVVIPQTRDVRIPPLDIDERPAFYWRELGVDKGLNVGEKNLGYAWRLDNNTKIFESAHNLGAVVAKEKYPQAWVQGQANPCLTDPVSIRAAVEYARQRLDTEPGIVSISLTSVDSEFFCDCPNCLKAGNVSARMLQFANAVAGELQKDYPGRFRLNFLAYWVTHEPPDPMVRAEPGVRIMFVNEGDHLKPLEYPELPEVAQRSRNNTRELRYFTGWQRTGGLVGVYEWWIPSCGSEPWQSIPWYSGETALKNLRFWHRHGIRYMCYETYGFEKKPDPYPLRWPLHYVGARGMWNPQVTAREVLSEACRKLYGPAAEPMRNFYQTLEQAALDTPEAGGNWGLGDPGKIYPPAVQAQASEYLQEALQATHDPAIRDRIRDEIAMWDEAREVLASPPSSAP